MEPTHAFKSDELEEQWKIFKESIYTAAAQTLGFFKRKHRDWVVENDAEIDNIFKKLHEANIQHLDKRACCQKKQQYQ